MSEPAGLIISALKERDIPFKRHEIESALHGPSTDTDANAKWIAEHLKPETLLSRDELILFSKLQGSDFLSNIESDPFIDTSRPLLDEDLQRAIKSLNESTSVLEQQTQILKSQFEVLNEQLRFRDGQSARGRRYNLDQLREKHSLEAHRLNNAANDLTLELDENMKHEAKRTATDGKKILSSIASRLRNDDRRLADLQAQAVQVVSTGDDLSIMKRTSQLCNILAEYVAETLYYRLDRLYMDSIADCEPDHVNPSTDAREAAVALEEDLESLYQEIDTMAQMYTSQQFNRPILRQLQDHCGQKNIISQKILSLLLETITRMTSTIETDTAHLHDRQSFLETFRALTALYQAERSDLSVDQDPSRKSLRRLSVQTPQSSPVKEASGQLPEMPAFERLFSQLGLSTKSILQHKDPVAAISALNKEEADMRERLVGLDFAIDPALASALACADSAAQQFSSALSSDADFSQTLFGVSPERQLSALETRLELAQQGAEHLATDMLYDRDKARKRFMDRWGYSKTPL